MRLKFRLKIFLMIIFLQYLPCAWGVMDIRMVVIRILVGRPDFRMTYRVPTDPDAGERNRQLFQEANGPKGEKLIDSFSDARSRFNQQQSSVYSHSAININDQPHPDKMKRRHHQTTRLKMQNPVMSWTQAFKSKIMSLVN